MDEHKGALGCYAAPAPLYNLHFKTPSSFVVDSVWVCLPHC